MGEALVVAAHMASIAFVAYLVAMAVAAVRPPPPPPAIVAALPYAFLVPCLDEEVVLDATLGALVANAGNRARVIVVDDDSADATAAIAHTWVPRGVELVCRHSPDARRGKGAALNAGLAYLRASLAPGEDVVVGVIDADGRLDHGALAVVDAALVDPEVGAVQLPVRIANRHQPGHRGRSLLTRFQDLEFVGFSFVLQAARHHVGTVGLGGNGQFTRLSALDTLGSAPWSDCLAEDLDLGLRLVVAGWKVSFGTGASVAQQGVVTPRALLRQRTRWVRGHLQCWARVPALLRAGLPRRVVADLLVYLVGPVLVMAISAAMAFSVLDGLARLAGITTQLAQAWPLRVLAVVADAAAVVPLVILAAVYRRRAGDVGRFTAAALAAGLVVYNLVWYLANWQALLATLCRRSGWTKTARLPEHDQATTPVPAGVGRA